MEHFLVGFEKRAREKDKDKSSKEDGRIKRFGKTLGAALGGNFAASLLVHPALMLDEELSAQSAREFGKKVKGKRGLKTKIYLDRGSYGVQSNLGSGYSLGDDTVQLSGRPLRGTMAHELGHADSAGRLYRKGVSGGASNSLSKAQLAGFHLGGGLNPALITATLAASNNEKIQKLAPYAGLLAAPLLLEEATASAKGLRDVYRFAGGKAALRAAPGLLAALGTYASLPGASSYMAHRYNQKRKKDKE